MKIHIGRYPNDPAKERKISVRIDRWDTWSMDMTLCMIIAPMLRQLKETKHSIPGRFVLGEHSDENFDAAEKAWNEILDKMIFSFEEYQTDWDEKFWLAKPELDFEDYPEDEGKDAIPVRWKTKGICDFEGRDKHWAKIQEGFDLFGKHFTDLWD